MLVGVLILSLTSGLLFVLDDLTGTGAGQDGIEGKEPGDILDLGVLEGSGISGGEGMWECCRWSCQKSL